MFIRFVAGEAFDDTYWSSGIICMARILIEEKKIDYGKERIKEIFEILQETLPCPPFSKKLKSGEWTPAAVSWFKDSAKEPIRLVWEIEEIVRQNEQPTRIMRTDKPGKIVY